MNKKIILFFVLAFIGIYQAQAQRYPIVIPKGSNKTIEATKDSLWVLKNSQFNNALADSKELIVVKNEVKTQKEIISVLKEKSTQQDSLIVALEKDRDFYKNTWKTCDKDLEKMVNTTKRQKLYTRVALISVPIAFVLGFFIK